ncbi:hypothetical protein C0J52_17037 [Blattella germanica]|nr:hypothetical protein C0J52_17037 [Blattella germanica]
MSFRSFQVISHCCPRYTEFRNTFMCRLDRRLFHRSSDSSTCFVLCLLPSTPWHVFNTAKRKARLSQSKSVAFRDGALLNLSWNAPIICAINSNN